MSTGSAYYGHGGGSQEMQEQAEWHEYRLKGAHAWECFCPRSDAAGWALTLGQQQAWEFGWDEQAKGGV